MNLRKLQLSDFILYNEINEEFNKKNEIVSELQFFHYINNMSNNQTTYVLYDDEDVIGCGTIIISSKMIHNYSKIGHIEDVFIRNNYQSQGNGKILIEALIKICNNEGCYKVILDCKEELKSFYERCGLENKNIQMSKYFNN